MRVERTKYPIACGSRRRGPRFSVFLAVVLFAGLWVHGEAALVDEESWRTGRQDLAAGRVADARGKFEKLLEKYPEESQLLLVLGLAAFKKGDREAAVAHVRKSVALAPDDAEALTFLGWLDLEVTGDVAAAVASYRRVAELRPELAEAHNNLGVAVKRKGDLEQAIESFSRALEANPDFAQAASNRGWVRVEQGDWQAAKEDFERSLGIDPDDEGALHGLARVRRELRDYSGAQDALARLGHRSPNFIYWLEWARVGLIRYYWVFLLLALGLFFYFRYKARARVSLDG